MASPSTQSAKSLGSLAAGDAPVLETLAQMTINTLERSGLDERSYFLVRIAGLAAMDAPPASYLLNTTAAAKYLEPGDLQGLIVALAPVIGTARTVSATGNILRAFATAMDLGEALAESERRQQELAAKH
jgi:4-carboxymuconolactone decarboxylase